MWKYLAHPNIVPFLGITPNPLQIILEWMPGGDLREYIRRYPDADRLGLVSFPPVAFNPTLTAAARYLTSLKASTISIPII